MADDNGNHFRLSPTTIGVLFALLAQLGGLIVWATSEHNARIALQERFDARVRDIDAKLAQVKPAELLEQRFHGLEERNKLQDEQLGRIAEFVRTLNDKQNIVNTSDGARIDSINGHLTRMDDRIDRIVQALDQTYNLLNQHLREHNRDGNK